MIIGTASTQLFKSFIFFQSGLDNVAEIWEFGATRRAYSRPISHLTMNAAPFSETYAKLYLDAKHLKKGLNRRGEGDSETFAALFGQYRTLP